jgi:outer membrane lipase/esterase
MVRAAVVAIAALLCSTAVHAQSPYSTVYVFGDSLSDRGRVPGLILQQNPSFPAGLLFPKSPPYFDSRFSDGPTYAERLPGLIGVAPNPGQNFAVGGAETNTDNLANSGLSFFGVTLPGIMSEINGFTGSGGRFQPSAVVVLFGGSNDYISPFSIRPYHHQLDRFPPRSPPSSATSSLTFARWPPLEPRPFWCRMFLISA